MNQTTTNIQDNSGEQRFELQTESGLAFIAYRWQNGKLALMHTEVPQQMEGKGIASNLAKTAFETAKQQHRKILIYCPYISTYIKKHPEYNELVEKDYNS